MNTMMRRIATIALLGVLLALAPGCGTLSTDEVPQSAVAARAMQAEDYDRAITAYTAAIQVEGDVYDFRLNRGKAYVAKGKLKDALADFNRALELRPGALAEIAPERAPLLVHMGEYEKALEDIQPVLAKRPRDPLFNYYKGTCLEGLRRYDEALEFLEPAAGALPSGSSQALRCARLRTTCLFQLKRFAEARKVYMNDYYNAKEAQGERLEDEDHYWAGVLAHVNLMDSEREKYWSKLSRRYRQEKGIK